MAGRVKDTHDKFVVMAITTREFGYISTHYHTI